MKQIRVNRHFRSNAAMLVAADATHQRCEIWRFTRKLKKLPRKPMSWAVLVQLGLENG